MALEDERRREIGGRIREMRQLRLLKQRQVAETCHVTLRAYQAWEGGTSGIDYENVERLAQALDVSPDWIMRGDPEAAPDLLKHLAGDASQLDRIEAKLDAILQTLGPTTTPEEVVAEALRAKRSQSQAGRAAVGKDRPGEAA